MGIVYHTNYIRWFEIARTELFRNMGIVHTDIEATSINLPLTQVFCHYVMSARYDDVLQVETEISYIKRASIKFSYRIWSETKARLLTEGYTIHACTDKNGKIIRIPAMITDKIQSCYQDI